MQARKSRTAYLNHTGQVSGAERVLVNMLRALDRTRYEAFVLCPANGELTSLVTAEGVPCLPVAVVDARFTWRPGLLLRSIGSLFRAVLSIRKQIGSIDPGAVHANSPRAGIVATLATMGTRKVVIWHVHDVLPHHPVTSAVRLLAFSSSRTRIVAVSNAAATAFAGRLPFGRRVRTIHNGTDLGRFPLKQPGHSPFRDSIGVPQDAFLVCAVGQICARKGLRELLDAFASIYSVAPSVHLAIVGKAVFRHEEQYRDALAAFARSAGIEDRVHFTGERADISAVMQAADLLVLNSHQEPFGLVLVEAMSSGTPVLATRVGGIPEIVSDGENGWLVVPGDTPALAEKLLELSRNPERLLQVAEFARLTTCPRFSLDRFARELHELYAELDRKPAYKLRTHRQPALAQHGED